jgi:hypothetical protein
VMQWGNLKLPSRIAHVSEYSATAVWRNVIMCFVNYLGTLCRSSIVKMPKLLCNFLMAEDCPGTFLPSHPSCWAFINYAGCTSRQRFVANRAWSCTRKSKPRGCAG